MKNKLLFVLCLLTYISFGQKAKQAYIKEAIALKDRGEYEKAITLFNDGLSKEPISTYALLERGVTYVQLGKYESATFDFERVLTLDVKNAKAYFYRGREKQRNGDLEGAIEDYNLALKYRLFDDEELFYLMATARIAQGKYSESLKDLEYILDNDPFHQPALTQRSYVWYKLKDYKGAERDANKAIKSDPTCPTPYIYRGMALVELGKNAEAIADFDKAVALGGENDQLLFYRGLAKYKVGDNEGALADLLDSKRKGYLEAVHTIKTLDSLVADGAKSR